MRIAPLEEPFDEAVTEALRPMSRFGPPIALFRTLAHNPPLTGASMHGLGGYSSVAGSRSTCAPGNSSSTGCAPAVAATTSSAFTC